MLPIAIAAGVIFGIFFVLVDIVRLLMILSPPALKATTEVNKYYQ